MITTLGSSRIILQVLLLLVLDIQAAVDIKDLVRQRNSREVDLAYSGAHNLIQAHPVISIGIIFLVRPKVDLL